jgi:transcriptional regulator with XRE-family HTH domain
MVTLQPYLQQVYACTIWVELQMKMPRSLKVSQDFFGTVKRALKDRGFPSQRALSEDLGLALSTVSNFMNGKPVDRAIFEEICLKLALDWKKIAAPVVEELSPSNEKLPEHSVVRALEQYQDWGEAPDGSIFYGRANELTQLEEWIVQDQCRLVLMLGMGGTGKTALSVKLSERIYEHFDALIWRSLRNAPPLQTLLTDLISEDV